VHQADQSPEGFAANALPLISIVNTIPVAVEIIAFFITHLLPFINIGKKYVGMMYKLKLMILASKRCFAWPIKIIVQF